MTRSWWRLCAALILSAALTLVAGCVLTAQAKPAQALQLRPVDEAAQEPAFHAYRADLIAAVRARSADGVLSAMGTDLRKRFEHWLRRPPAVFGGSEQEDWTRLEQLLVLGGTFTTTRGALKGRREFCAPYVYSAYPHPLPEDLRGELDPWVLLEADVPVHMDHDPASVVLTRLSFAVVKADGGGIPSRGGQPPTWTLVYLPGERIGYVLDSQIRDPVDYHACFATVEGRWQMVRFERGLSPAWTPIK